MFYNQTQVHIMATQKQLAPLSLPSDSGELNSSQVSKVKEQTTRSPNSDWTSLFGLLMLASLTGVSELSMIVDVSALRHVLQPELSNPVKHKTEILGQSEHDEILLAGFRWNHNETLIAL